LSNGYTVDRAAKAARVFHIAANRLEELRGDTKPDANIDTAYLDETLGIMAGVTVLEALALELVLKARLLQSGINPPKWHSHSDLFALLPEAEQQVAGQIYQANRNSAMRETLAEVLNFSAKAFERWRYHHEQPAEASLGEMQQAFDVLVAPL
jgi:HEPN domain-containing protein